MKKFIVYLLVIVLAVSLGFAVFYLVRDNEVISISSASIYKDVGESFTIDVTHLNKKSYTEITVSTSNENIVSYDSSNETFKAVSGGVVRINFRTTNANFRNLWCDVIVGDGTVESPYYISTPEQLASIGSGVEIADADGHGTGVYAGSTKYAESYSAYTSDKCYKLVDDIDVKDINSGFWVPLQSFSGRFDGNGLTIRNINIDREKYIQTFENSQDYNPNYAKEYAGVFQKITETGIVYNLKLDNVSADGIYDNFGIIAGENKGTLERIEVKSAYLSVQSKVFGGIVGHNITTDAGENQTYDRRIARIDRCSVNMTLGKKITYNENNEEVPVIQGVNGTIGGLVGENKGGTIVYSYVRGEVNFLSDDLEPIVYGGLIGHNSYVKLNNFGGQYTSIYQGGNIKDCYSDLKTHFETASTNHSSSFAGAIAINDDFSNGDKYNDDASKKLVHNFIIGVYYNKTNLNFTEENITKNFTGVSKFNLISVLGTTPLSIADEKTIVYGLTTEEMTDKTNFVSHMISEIAFDEDGNSLGMQLTDVDWLFDTVWAMNIDSNDGLPYLNYQLVYIPDDFETAGVPIVVNDLTYQFERDEVVTEFSIISGSNGRLSIDLGETYQLVVAPNGLKLTWFSSNPETVSVDEKGVITANKVGVVTITAKSSAGFTSSITIVVHDTTVVITGYPTSISLIEDSTYQVYGLNIYPSVPVNYQITNTSIATVNASGLITGVSAGSTTLIISAGTTEVSVPVVVNAKATNHLVSITLNTTNVITEYDGSTNTGTLQVTGAMSDSVSVLDIVTFGFSSNLDIIKLTKVNNTTYNYEIKGTGKARITVTVTSPSNYIGTAYCDFTINTPQTVDPDPEVIIYKIVLSPSATTLNVGDSKQLKATITPSTHGNITWGSLNESVVTISDKGYITAVGVGTTTVYASVENSNGTPAYGYASVTVSKVVPLTISLNPKTSTLSIGQQVTITATLNKEAVLTWTTSDTSISSITYSGVNCVVTMKGAGTVTITALNGTTSASVTVSATDPNAYSYYISTPEQLNAVRYHLDKDFVIIKDLDMSGYSSWEPIGTNKNPFKGSIKGNSSAIKISNLHVSGSYTYAGLFGYSLRGRFENMNITNSSFADATYSGSLLGYGNNVTIKNVKADSNNVSSISTSGGIVGYITSKSTVTNCSLNNKSTVNTAGQNTAYKFVGGIVGNNAGCSVSNCSVNSISSISLASGVHGYVGGIVGHNSGDVRNCKVDSASMMANDTDNNYVGGIVGYDTKWIDKCVVKSSSIKGYYAGGIGGALNYAGTASFTFGNSNNGLRKLDLTRWTMTTVVSETAVKETVTVEGNQVGGLFGSIVSGVVQNCYARATLKGYASNAVLGGFAATIKSSGFDRYGNGKGQAGVIDTCYSACKFEGSGKYYYVTSSYVHKVYSIAGTTRNDGFCFNYVYDKDISKANHSTDSNIFTKDKVQAKKSTSEMSNWSTYSDKGFSTIYWNHSSGYPTLKCE